MSKNKKQITTKSANSFNSNSEIGEALWCGKFTGLHLKKYTTKTSWRVKYRAHGQQHIKTIGSFPNKTVKQAQIEAQQIINDATKGIDAVQKSKDIKEKERQKKSNTFSKYLHDRYSLTQAAKKSGSETIRILNKEFSDWHKLPLQDLTVNDADKWNLKQAKLGKSHSTIKRYWAACNGLLNHAVQKGYISNNPLSSWSPDKLSTQKATTLQTRQYLKDEESKILLERLISRPECVYSNILTLIYFTGLRPSDALSLEWEHISLDFKTLTKVIEKTSETKANPTTLPLNDSAVDLLSRWQTYSRVNKGLVFKSTNGGKIHHRTLAKKMNGYKKQLKNGTVEVDGISKGLKLPPSFTPYSLRHNFASQLIMKGADIVTVSKLMCHSNINTTITHYAHLAPDHKRQAANLMNTELAFHGNKNVAQF